MASHIGRRKFLAASKTGGFKPIKFAIVFRVPGGRGAYTGGEFTSDG